MLELQQSIGWPDEKLLYGIPSDFAWMMWNPPWALGYILPLGWFDYNTSRTVYFLLSIFLCMLSAAWLWEALGGKQKQVWIAWIIAFSFGPTLQIIRLGQVTILMLFGCALFLRMVQRKQWFWAGVAASTILIKPHTLYLFGAALVLWALSTRRWMVILGGGSGIAMASLIVMAFDPQVFQQYFFAWQQYPPEEWLTATPGAMLRIVFGWNLVWLQYIPSLLGLAWLAWYWLKVKDDWHWEKTVSVLTLASAATAAYGWVADNIVVIPALLAAAISIISLSFDLKHNKNLFLLYPLVAYVIVNLLVLFPKLPSHGYWWFAGILWLVYCLLEFAKKYKQPLYVNSLVDQS